MDTGQPPLRPLPATPPPRESWPAPALGTPAPGDVASARRAAPEPPAPSTAEDVPASAPSAADEVRMARAMFRDGQRLLYYSANFGHLVTAERVYGHGRMEETLLALALIRLQGGLERLLRAQMPMARSLSYTSDGDYTVEWRDLVLHLQNRRLLMPADKSFLAEMNALRARLVHGEIVAVNPRDLLHLAHLGTTLFTQLDPEYQKPERDPHKDALPAAHTATAAPAAPPAPALAPPGGTLTPWPTAPAPAEETAPPPAAPALHSAHLPTARLNAAGAQRSGIALDETESCMQCHRPVRSDDRWCPRCGTDLSHSPSYHPTGATGYAAAPGTATRGRARGIFNRFLGRGH